MNHKSQTQYYLQYFLALIETQFNTKIKSIRTDINGLEFQIHNFFLGQRCHTSEMLCLHFTTKGVMESKHQHILNVAQSFHF